MRRAILGLALALLAPTRGAAMSPEDSAQLRRAYKAAVEGRCGQALDIWRTLRDVVGDRTLITGNMAHCLEALGRDREAAATFRKARAYALVDEAPANDHRESRLARLDARITRLGARLASAKRERGTLRVTCDREGVRVAIDDRPTTLCPATFDLEAGPHTLVSVARGLEPLEQPVVVGAGETLDVEVSFDASWPWIVGGAAIGAAAITAVVLIVTADEPQPRVRLTVDE